MTNSELGRDTEETALLSNHHNAERTQTTLSHSNDSNLSPYRVLPVAFLAALAMSSTAATAYYAYATLLCRDPNHCDGDEMSKYSRFIAVTTSISNMLGMIALGPLQAMMKQHQVLGLLLWQLTRSLSPIMLLLGFRTQNIYIALSGRIFDGIASDNLLHFTLNTIYALSAKPEATSSLIGYSLALYMIGISISPFVGGLFGNFTVSFFIAIGLFAIAIFYNLVWISPRERGRKQLVQPSHCLNTASRNGPLSYSQLLAAFIAPLHAFVKRPACLFCGLSMLTYNMVQSYTFNALLVHTSLRFGFSGKQNGLILTIAHSVAALYIFVTLYVIPRTLRRVSRHEYQDNAAHEKRWKPQNSIRVVISLSFQSLSLIIVGLATEPWHIYAATAMLALGLPTPSFMKAYVVSLFEGSDKSEALAALAALEVIGDVLGPVILGAWQSYSTIVGGVFFGAAGTVAVSLAFFVFALGLVKWERKKHAGDAEQDLQQ